MKHILSRSIYVLFVAGILLCIFVVPADSQTTTKKKEPLEQRITELEKDVTCLFRERDLYTIEHLPEYLMLCDKRIPIFKGDLRERFEREFFQLLENKGLLTIIVKRYLKYLSMINEEIEKMALPADLIYLVVSESYLNPRAVSKANAAGLWQFIKETGKREGLRVDDYIDERYNIKKSTQSGLTHLKHLYDEFDDWLLAMAAYNAGSNRIKEALENQATKDFFDLFLPEETERYIFRILALKEIITNRERYGIKIDEKELYRPFAVDAVLIKIEKEVHTNALARCMDMSYRQFRYLNLHIRKYILPKGTYTINVPVEKKESFFKKLKTYPFVLVEEDK